MYISSATGLNKGFLLSTWYIYLDLTTNDTLLKWCNTIGYVRSINCGNTTLSRLAMFEVDTSISSTPFSVSSTPSKTDIFVEECGMYICRHLDYNELSRT